MRLASRMAFASHCAQALAVRAHPSRRQISSDSADWFSV
jgi:hypothetical protein